MDVLRRENGGHPKKKFSQSRARPESLEGESVALARSMPASTARTTKIEKCLEKSTFQKPYSRGHQACSTHSRASEAVRGQGQLHRSGALA
jgi:hypothetical protein